MKRILLAFALAALSLSCGAQNSPLQNARFTHDLQHWVVEGTGVASAEHTNQFGLAYAGAAELHAGAPGSLVTLSQCIPIADWQSAFIRFHYRTVAYTAGGDHSSIGRLRGFELAECQGAETFVTGLNVGANLGGGWGLAQGDSPIIPPSASARVELRIASGTTPQFVLAYDDILVGESSGVQFEEMFSNGFEF